MFSSANWFFRWGAEVFILHDPDPNFKKNEQRQATIDLVCEDESYNGTFFDCDERFIWQQHKICGFVWNNMALKSNASRYSDVACSTKYRLGHYWSFLH